MTMPPSPCTGALDAYLRLNRASPWEWLAALRRITGCSEFQCQSEFANSELGSLSSLCVNEGQLIYFSARQTFRLRSEAMRSFALFLVKSTDAGVVTQGRDPRAPASIRAMQPGESLDLLVEPDHHVVLVQPESRGNMRSPEAGHCWNWARIIEDYLFRARFFRDHQDAMDTTDALMRSLFSGMQGDPMPEPLPEVDRRLMRAVRKIEDQARWEFNLGELAAHSGVSTRNLYYLMKRETGLTPYRLYQRQRLIRVRRRLVDCQCDAPHISWYAADEGFSHLGRFAALYRLHFGELPSETAQWRRPLGARSEGTAPKLAVF